MSTVTVNDLKGSFYLYLEGILVRHAKITVTGEDGGYASFTASLPISKNPRLIRRIRPKTTGYVCFGKSLFILLEGELAHKRYRKSPESGRLAELTFTGVSGNLAMMKYALASTFNDALQALPTNSANFAVAADFWQINGLSIGISSDAAIADLPAGNTTAFLASSVNNNLIATPFSNGLKDVQSGTGAFDMTQAFREMMRGFIYGSSRPDGFSTSGIKVAGSLASSYLGVVNGRYRLIESVMGYTSQELISKFYGAGLKDNEINPFLNSILGEGASGEFNLLQVMRLLADRSFHSMTEMVGPPALVNETTKETVVARMLMAPRLFAADPPVCNLFFPQVTTSIEFGVSPLKVTRLITAQAKPADDNTAAAFLSVSPIALERKMMDGERHVNFANAITEEESDVGVLAQTQMNIYGSTLALTDYGKELGNWFDQTNPLRFYVARNEGQPATIAMEFNPFVAQGFPGMAYDPDLGLVRGLVRTVTHVDTPTGKQTNVLMTHCFVDDDACETLIEDVDFESGFGGKFKLVKNGEPSDVYERLLGCSSFYAEMQKTSKDAAGKSLAQLMEQKYNEFAASQSPHLEKEAVFSFIKRNIATINDLQRFYGAEVAESETDVEIPIPNQLQMEFPFASPENDTKIFLVDQQGKRTEIPYVVPEGTKPGAFQVVERVTPVVNYVNDIGD